MTADRAILVVHPSPDLYGADLQLLQTVIGLVEDGRRTVVALPEDGPLVPRLREAGAEVTFVRFPVLRKGNASARAMVAMISEAVGCLPRALSTIRRLRPAVLLVNTVTLPWWLLAGRLSRTPTVAHLHEAETQPRRIVRQALVAPLFLARRVIVISQATLDTMAEVQPRLAPRARLIYNGVPQPPDDPSPARRGRPFRLAVVGRLSPRKAPDVALETTALLVAQGHDVHLEVVGSIFPGYEWYEEQLRNRAGRPDLEDRVTFTGYAAPVWPVYQRCDVLLAPSLHEPFGNVVVEGQLSRRPVVAAAAQGHLESVVDDSTGLLVPPGDPAAAAAATARLIDDAALAARLADHAREEAIRRFSVERYRLEVARLIREVAETRAPDPPSAGPV